MQQTEDRNIDASPEVDRTAGPRDFYSPFFSCSAHLYSIAGKCGDDR